MLYSKWLNLSTLSTVNPAAPEHHPSGKADDESRNHRRLSVWGEGEGLFEERGEGVAGFCGVSE